MSDESIADRLKEKGFMPHGDQPHFGHDMQRIAALEAHVARLRDEITFGLNHYIDAGFERMQEVLAETPEQSLSIIEDRAREEYGHKLVFRVLAATSYHRPGPQEHNYENGFNDGLVKAADIIRAEAIRGVKSTPS